MPNAPFNVLFICTGNSARSILAEGLMNHIGNGRFRAWSAGSTPRGTVHPMTLSTLSTLHVPAPESGFRSKSWEEFAQADAPRMDFVFTVCDNAAGEVCPVWPGQPMTAHWGQPDPAAEADGTAAQQQAFLHAAHALKRRIELLLALPIDKLEPMSLQSQLNDIGRA